jgi:hypothetical protein
MGRFRQGLEGSQVHRGGADGAAIEEEADYALDFVSEDEDRESVPTLCNFILPMQESSSSSKDSHDDLLSADVIEINNDVVKKLGFFDPDPYLDREYRVTAPPGGFPFGGRRKTPVSIMLMTSPSPVCIASVGMQSSPGRFVSSVGSQTVSAKSRSLGTQTSPASTPDVPR